MSSSGTSNFLASLLASCLIFLKAILISSAACFACLTYSFLVSSVKAGIFKIIISPLLFGVKPILASYIPFSIALKALLSKGLIANCLASGIEIFANCFICVGSP